MRTVTVNAPDGKQWQVRVAWLPRWKALALRFGGWRRKRNAGTNNDPDRKGFFSGWGSGGGDASIEGILIGLALIVVAVVVGTLFWWLLLPLLLLVVDGLVIAAVLIVAIPARVLLGRPWTVEAVTAGAGGTEDYFNTEVRGWRRALQTRDDIAGQLREGLPVVGTLHNRR